MKITNYCDEIPDVDNTHSLGESGKYFKDLYIKGSFKDGTNTKTLAQLSAITQYTDALAVTAIKADAAWHATNWDTAYGWGNHAGLYLPVAGKAADSDLLDGHDTAYFQTALTFGIADTNKVQINSADVADNDYAKFTTTGLEGRSYSEVLSDIGAAPALGADDNYVTDAEKIVIGNTSGTNTGDASGHTGLVTTDQTVGQTIGATGARLTKLWATDITCTNNIVANLTGDVTGNCSGTAATVTGAAQANITSLGTLTSLAITGTTAYLLDVISNNDNQVHVQTTGSAKQASFFLENDRGSLASYGGMFYGGTAFTVGDLFGFDRADRLFVASGGASNLGMSVGTINAGDLTLGTTNVVRVTIAATTGLATFAGAVQVNGNTTLGDASTDLITMTGRAIFRTAASDPQHATAGSRPAGTVAEIAYYNGKMYFCTNAATPTWEKITSG